MVVLCCEEERFNLKEAEERKDQLRGRRVREGEEEEDGRRTCGERRCQWCNAVLTTPPQTHTLACMIYLWGPFIDITHSAAQKHNLKEEL